MTLGTDDIQVVTFRVGGQEFAFEILQVERITRLEEPAALPQAPEFLEGVVPFDQGVIPVVDLRKRLEAPAARTDDTRLMVVQVDGERVGLVVDQVREVLRVDSGAIAPPPSVVRGLAAAFIHGIIARPGRTIILLNVGRILSSSERLALAALEA